tara:strand:+ start:12734 stop:13522 length:789 start_codon:yes stop_codon:yes gene_type:complete
MSQDEQIVEKTDLVIQGPITTHTLPAIERLGDYLELFENVIFSTWDTSELSEEFINECKEKIKSHDLTYTETTLPDRDSVKTLNGANKRGTFLYSVVSTHAGLKKATSPFCIKMRSDEFYGDFRTMLKQMHLNKENMVCGNIFHRSSYRHNFHIGDHVFGAQTKYLKSAYNFLIEKYFSCESLQADESWVSGNSGISAEVILSRAYMRSVILGSSPPKSLSNDWGSYEFADFFDVIDINTLGEYQARHGHKNTTYTHTKNKF